MMKKQNKIYLGIGIVIAIIVIGGIWYGVSRKPASTPTTKEPIKIGVIGPLTGIRATGGEYMRKGLEMALEEINSEGINGEKMKLVYEDTQYKPDVAMNGFRKLTDVEGIKFVIGFQNSSCLLSCAPIAEEKKVLIIGYGTQANKISEAGDYIFRTQIASRQELPVVADFIRNKLNLSRIAILYLLSDYGIEYNEILTEEFEKLGGELVASEGFKAEEKDFRTQLTKISGSNPEAIFVVGASKHIGMIINQAHELGINIQFLGGSPIESKDILNIAGNLANGVIYPYPYNIESTIESQKSFRDKYKEKYKEPPTMLAANAYDALKLLAEGIKKCGENVECVKNYLYSVKDYHGASGKISFDENGDVQKEFVFKTIKNGQFVPYEQP